MVVYEDLLCPYCRRFEDVTREALPRLADAGRVQVEYRPFNLLSPTIGNYSLRAANAFAVVRAASGDLVAKEFHDLLYERQPSEDEALELSDAQVDELLVGHAVEAGADESSVRDGIETLAQADWVARATAEAHAAGVRGTPTVFLDGQRFETGSSVEELATNLLAELE